MSMRIEKHKLIAGIYLWTFWICAVTPFIVQECTNSYQGDIVRSVWLMGELVVALFGLWTLRARVDKVVVIVFLLLSYVDTVIFNKLSVLYWVNGIRLYVGLIFMFPIIRYFWEDPERRRYFVSKMDRLIYLYLVIQFPCMVVQCIRYGAFDNVSGSIGWMASGTASTIIYLSSFYLMIRRWDRRLTYFENISRNWVLIFLLIPTYLNETKISFIYIALYFFFLVPMDRQFIKRLVVVIPLMLVVMSGVGALYVKMVDYDKQTNVTDVYEYLFGNDILLELVEYAFENDVVEVNEGDYSRGLKFYIMPEIFERHQNTWLTGFGLSQFKGGSYLDKTEFAKRYFWMLQGTMMQVHMALVEMGVPGALLYIVFWITAFRLWRRHKGERSMRMSWMFGLVTVIFSVYIPPFMIPPFYMQFMFMVFACSRWKDLPPYRHVPLFGNRKIMFTWRETKPAK